MADRVEIDPAKNPVPDAYLAVAATVGRLIVLQPPTSEFVSLFLAELWDIFTDPKQRFRLQEP